VAIFTVLVKAEYRGRPASDALPGKPICLLHERLADTDLPDIISRLELVPPPPPPDGPFKLSESDLPLPAGRSIAEVMDVHRTNGEIGVVVGEAAAPGQIGELMKMLSRACIGSELDARWFDVVPPA
jgi:hypothetical protein